MRAFAVVTALLCGGLLGATPAHAVTHGRIDLHVAGLNQSIGTGVLATAVCVAHTNADVGWVADPTSVSCTVNGYPSGTQTNRGGDAAVTVANGTTAPVTVCVHGQATLTSVLVLPEVVTADKCFTTPLGAYAQ